MSSEAKPESRPWLSPRKVSLAAIIVDRAGRVAAGYVRKRHLEPSNPFPHDFGGISRLPFPQILPDGSGRYGT